VARRGRRGARCRLAHDLYAHVWSRGHAGGVGQAPTAGEAKSSLGDAYISLGDAESSLGDAPLQLRALQADTGGLTEFVPLPFVHMEAPLYLKGGARRGPTRRESVLVRACVSEALVETSTQVRRGYHKYCLHHDPEVLNKSVPPPLTRCTRWRASRSTHMFATFRRRG
jgi:hypothetical protein